MSNRIKKLRLEKKISQQKLADEIGVTRQAISLFEKGERDPKLETWIKLSNYLNVSVGYLKGISDEDYYLDILKILDKYGVISNIEKDRDAKLVNMKDTIEELIAFLASTENKSDLAIEKNNELLVLISKLAGLMSIEFIASSYGPPDKSSSNKPVFDNNGLIKASDKYISLFSDMLNKMSNNA
ncbi:MAG: helix-turn-helix transcriptional regulator [Lactobacillus sp.]|nr:helix-turn-helix transcriptional regulator [Lactobacillus sp.]